MNRQRITITILGIIGLLVVLCSLASAAPSGANITRVVSVETMPLNSTPSNNSAQAGNVTELMLTSTAVTQSWQGYFGNVSGTIQLANAAGKAMYNWSIVNIKGEIYASTNSSIQWANIQCLNYTAEGTLANDVSQAGATSLYGYNMSQIETIFNISWNDVDGLNETFTLSGAGTHDPFFTGNRDFFEGECMNTRIFDSSGSGNNDNFEEVLLYEPQSTSLIFTALLENKLGGFDTYAHDFEMLVLENGHGTDTESTPYYFFLELA